MRQLKIITSAVVFSTLSVGALTIPTTVRGETSANIGVSNMYLWRGKNLSPDGGMVSGGLDYAAGNGLYAGVWTTSENGGTETDLYLGYGGSAGDFSYDISYWHYLYPEDGKLDDTDLSELVVAAGFGPVKAAAYISVDDEYMGASDDWVYYTLGANFDKFNVTYGQWMGSDANDYSHVTASYAATDEFTFTISVAMEDTTPVDEDPLFAASYKKTFDLK